MSTSFASKKTPDLPGISTRNRFGQRSLRAKHTQVQQHTPIMTRRPPSRLSDTSAATGVLPERGSADSALVVSCTMDTLPNEGGGKGSDGAEAALADEGGIRGFGMLGGIGGGQFNESNGIVV